MNDGWAALLFRPDEVSDDALALGFALALAGFDVERPRLEVAALDGLPGWSAAFYASGVKRPGYGAADELAHQRSVFTGDTMTPAIGVRLAARRGDGAEVNVYTIVHGPGVDVGEALDGDDEDELEDEGEAEGAEEDADADETVDDDDDDDDAPEQRESAAARLAEAFGRPILADLARALFQADKTILPRLAAPEPAFAEAMTARLVAVLRRTPGRGAFAPPALGGVAAPATYEAFARVYDFQDPDDPRDLYRELAIGRIEGTLHFHRAADADARCAKVGYPIGALFSSHLADPKRLATLVLLADGVRLALVDERGTSREAGPTFPELLRYLALGYAKRSELEEEIISALMLRAAVRVA